ncbi:TRAP transporter large permease [Acuticoccus sp. M5D2P5]|uniref:TRAP transporter large permease n=1 Tax=Acuticoccus kalidii TaxID=2910977 RepID=UPI001F2C125B|nr:TRAP transporter large permease [Acuticoccus kalidii]MCF3934497.1 TRAP transporter large permease [Acuticoccus kalidii]
MGPLLLSSGALFVLGVPIALAMSAGALLYLYLSGNLLLIGPATWFSGLDKAPIMAIPFFILSAEILSRGGAVARLVDAIDSLIGHIKGGLAVVAVIATMIFSAVSGSSIATAAAVGIVLIPQMLQRGYPERFVLGLIASAGGLGILIPPSVPLIIYGTVTGVSVGKLFQAGILPGIMIAILLCLFAILQAHRLGLDSRPPDSWARRRQALWDARAIFSFPVVILGSIYGGIFTPSESSALAVIYALVITARTYMRMGLGQLLAVMVSACATTAAILMILAAAALFGYAVTLSGIPQLVVDWIASLGLDRTTFLLLINLVFIVLGMFLEIISIILITLPIIFPLLAMFGVDPIHFAIIMIVNMELAVITPPIGLNLFAIAAIAKRQVKDLFIGVVPFYLVIFIGLIIVTYVSDVSLLLVRWAPI